jgi:hypothetical protein
VQELEDLSARLLVSVSCQLVKSIGMCRKIQKITKPVLLESRSITLQLWLIESGLKPNIFKVILEFRKRVSCA